MSINKMFLCIYSTLIFLMVVLAVISVLMMQNQDALNNAQKVRYASYLAGDELRQSSQDLTRLARTYVSTAEKKYEDMYWEVLDVRGGKKPRPDGRTIPLQKIMADLGFTEGEFARLKEAAANSDGLVWTETVAMNAVKGKFHDSQRKFTKKGEPDLNLARKLMFDDQYHRYVGEIMSPIKDFFKMLDGRTGQSVEVHVDKSRVYMWMSQVIIFILVSICVVSYFVIRRKVNLPVAVLTEEVVKIGGGDLSRTFDTSKKDEIGILSGALMKMTSELRETVEGIVGGAETLVSSSKSLSTIAGDMESGAEKASETSTTVAGAADEMSTNMDSVSSNSERASENMTMVASATEEMTATVREIAQNSERARGIAGNAVDQAKNASQKVDELGVTVKEISRVTEVITEISEQTNLLALNATIEAARAGEFGKGFAVVADEIKTLAKQTADSTQEIKTRIEGIQGATDETVTQITKISGVIAEINDIVSTIATAVEEQSATTQEIAQNVGQASVGMQEVTDNVTQSSAASGEIARGMSELNVAANEITDRSAEVSRSAGDMQRLADQLFGMMSRFKL